MLRDETKWFRNQADKKKYMSLGIFDPKLKDVNNMMVPDIIDRGFMSQSMH